MEKKEKKEGSKKKLIFAFILGVFVVLSIVFLVLYLTKPKYTVNVKTGGGTITREIVVEKNEIKKLPEITPPDGKVLVTWVNERMEAVRPNLHLYDDMTIEPVFEDEKRETVTLSFVSGTTEKIPDITITKGSKVILPVKPSHDEWSFLYWVDKDGYIVLNNRVINENTTIYAYWFKPSKEKVTISFDTGTDEKIESIIINKGSTLVLPIPSKNKDNMKFKGWLDENGNLVNSEEKIKSDKDLTAKWVEPYTCPEGCTPNEGGETCSKVTTQEASVKEVCPSNSFLYYGKCITKEGAGDAHIRQCSMFGDEVMYGDYCMKVVNKVTEYSCPEGFVKNGDTSCRKTETLNCIQN